MRFAAGLVVLIFITSVGTAVLAQNGSQNAAKLAPPSVTVPITLDQGRVVIDVDLLLRDGSTERVRGWVDNGNPDLCMNRRVANLLAVNVSCDGQTCSGSPKLRDVPLEIVIGGMKI